jgi:hypothetical protein
LTRNARNLRLAIALGVAALAVYFAYVMLRVLNGGT